MRLTQKMKKMDLMTKEEKRLIIAISSNLEFLGLLMLCNAVDSSMVSHMIATIESTLTWMNHDQIEQLKHEAVGCIEDFLDGKEINGWKLHHFPNGYKIGNDEFPGKTYIVTKDNLRPPFIKGQQYIENYIAL